VGFGWVWGFGLVRDGVGWGLGWVGFGGVGVGVGWGCSSDPGFGGFAGGEVAGRSHRLKGHSAGPCYLNQTRHPTHALSTRPSATGQRPRAGRGVSAGAHVVFGRHRVAAAGCGAEGGLQIFPRRYLMMMFRGLALGLGWGLGLG